MSFPKQKPTIIAILGLNGPERGVFIEQITGIIPDARDDRNNEAPQTSIFKGQIGDRDLWLLDTPACDISTVDHAESIRKALTRESGRKSLNVDGVVSLHDITDSAIAKTANESLITAQEILPQLSRDDFLVITTFWDLLRTPDEGIRAEEELKAIIGETASTHRVLDSSDGQSYRMVMREYASGFIDPCAEGRGSKIASTTLEEIMDLISDKDKQIEGLKAELDATKEAAFRKLQDEQQKAAIDNEEWHQQTSVKDEQIESLKAELEATKEDASRQLQQKAAIESEEWHQQASAKDEQIECLRAKLQSTKEEYDRNLQDEQQRAAAENEEWHQQASVKDEQIDSLRTELQSTKEEHGKNLQDIQQRTASEREGFLRQFSTIDKQVGNLRAELQATKEASLKDLQEVQRKTAAEINSLRQQVLSKDKQIESMRTEFESTGDTTRDLRNTQQRITAENASLLQNASTTAQEMEDLRAELQATREASAKEIQEAQHKAVIESEGLLQQLQQAFRDVDRMKQELHETKNSCAEEISIHRIQLDAEKMELSDKLLASETERSTLLAGIEGFRRNSSSATSSRSVHKNRANRTQASILNTLDADGEFPLYGVAAGGNYDEVKRMLEQGANPSLRTRYHWTPLHWAVGNGHTKIVQLLLEHGADINATSDTGRTPLSMAQTDTMRSLLRQRGARF